MWVKGIILIFREMQIGSFDHKIEKNCQNLIIKVEMWYTELFRNIGIYRVCKYREKQWLTAILAKLNY